MMVGWLEIISDAGESAEEQSSIMIPMLYLLFIMGIVCTRLDQPLIRLISLHDDSSSDKVD